MGISGILIPVYANSTEKLSNPRPGRWPQVVTTRNIITIDEEKCDGCGLCAEACHEGAIEIIDGKARLVSDEYCDGLGDCIGECPQDAITIEKREAVPFSEEAVARRQADLAGDTEEQACGAALPCGCPGSMARSLEAAPCSTPTQRPPCAAPIAQLGNWPVQLHLVPPLAPYLDGADLLIAADCTAFASPDFHERFLAGRVCLVGCPKLDDTSPYVAKLAAIFAAKNISSVEVVRMEVPCCGGIVNMVEQALEASGPQVPLTVTTLGVHGDIVSIEQAGA